MEKSGEKLRNISIAPGYLRLAALLLAPCVWVFPQLGSWVRRVVLRWSSQPWQDGKGDECSPTWWSCWLLLLQHQLRAHAPRRVRRRWRKWCGSARRIHPRAIVLSEHGVGLATAPLSVLLRRRESGRRVTLW